MYLIITVPTDAPTDIEALGSKRKFWLKRPVDDASGEEESWLFKAARQHTGEDWSEKVAAELSALLGLPHATYEFAQWTEGVGANPGHGQELDRIDQSEVDKIFALIPPERISDVSIQFSKKQLSINRNELTSGSN